MAHFRRREVFGHLLARRRVQATVYGMATVQRRPELYPHYPCEEVRIAYLPASSTSHNRISYDLPEDVFEPGEKRPTKAKKGRAANKVAGPALAKKRSHTEAKLDVRSSKAKDVLLRRPKAHIHNIVKQGTVIG